MSSIERVDFKTASERSPEARSMIRHAHPRIYPIALPEFSPSFHLQLGQSIFTIGSCFARNIESRLHRLGFRIPTLDFKVLKEEWKGVDQNGILNKYTPPSIYQEIAWAKRVLDSGGVVTEESCAGMFLPCAGGVVDLQLGGFQAVSPTRALERRAELFRIWRNVFTTDCVTITLGLTEAWYDTETGAYIQQRPSETRMGDYLNRFRFENLSTATCYDFIDRAVKLITSMNPAVRILITTSPVHLQRTYTTDDILTANSFSKSKLRAVAGEIAEHHPNVDYFPSYEMATLTKDWNIWESDLVHVSAPFVGRIVSRLLQAYVRCATDEERARLDEQISTAIGDSEKALAGKREIYEAQQAHNPAFVLSMGKLHFAKGEFAEAIAAMEKGTRMPDMRTLSLVAECYRSMKQYPRAIRILRYCADPENGKLKYWSLLIQTQVDAKLYLDAEDSARRALKLFPKISRIHHFLIQALTALDRHADAITAVMAAVEACSDNEALILLAARMHIAQGDYVSAAPLLDRVPEGSRYHGLALKLTAYMKNKAKKAAPRAPRPTTAERIAARVARMATRVVRPAPRAKKAGK